MAFVNARSLAKMYLARKKDGKARLFFHELKEALESGQLRPEEFSVRALFEAFVPNGRELVESWDPRGSINGGYGIEALEAAGVVDTAAFSTINGQLLITKVMEAWNNPVLIWRDLVEVIPTGLNGEKIPGIAAAADEIDTVPEAGEYPTTGLHEIYIETPVVPKKGTMINVTQEAIFHDRTGVLLTRAKTISDAMALNVEKRVLDCVFGITNTYKRNGVSGNTYLTSGAYVNVKTTNALSDYSSIDAAEQLFEDMTDPDTGEAIIVNPDTIVVPTALKKRLSNILRATNVRVGSGAAFTADPTDNVEFQTDAPNPLTNAYNVKSNAYVKSRSSSSTTWWIGEFKRAFALMENWPINVQQAPANSEAEFARDIVARWKVNHKAVPAVMEPRRVVKCTA